MIGRLPAFGACGGDALEFVAALVVADLAEHVGDSDRIGPPLLGEQVQHGDDDVAPVARGVEGDALLDT